MQALTSLVAIIFTAASLTACIGAEIHDDMSSEEEPEAQLENDASETEFRVEASASLLSSWDQQMYTSDSPPGGRVRFEAYGDIVEVCDIKLDGKGVDLYYNDNTVHVGGNGNCTTRNRDSGSTFNLIEGAVYEFRICLNDGESCNVASWSNIN